MPNLDAYARPPEALRLHYKRYQKSSINVISHDDDIFDAERQSFAGCIPSSLNLPPELQDVFRHFLEQQDDKVGNLLKMHPLAYEHPHVPGTYQSAMFGIIAAKKHF